MPIRISGVNLPEKKRITIALTSIYGVGRQLSRQILQQAGINENTKTQNLTAIEEKKLRDYIESNIKVEGDLRRDVMQNIRHLIDTNTYRGSRHAKHLPTRGQRTRTNSRTVRGNIRKTAGSGKRAAAEKT